MREHQGTFRGVLRKAAPRPRGPAGTPGTGARRPGSGHALRASARPAYVAPDVENCLESAPRGRDDGARPWPGLCLGRPEALASITVTPRPRGNPRGFGERDLCSWFQVAPREEVPKPRCPLCCVEMLRKHPPIPLCSCKETFPAVVRLWNLSSLFTSLGSF